MKKPTILITSPSIDTSKNIGGISSLTRLLIIHNNYVNYSLTEVGRRDSQKRNVQWILNQVVLIYNYTKKLITNKEIKIVHINIPLSELSIFINLALLTIARILSKKIVVHLRGGSLSLNRNINKLQKETISLCINLADKVLVLGKKEFIFLSRFYKINNSNKISILPNAVEIPKNILPKPRSKDLKIIFIGRIDKQKGLYDILNALETIKNKVQFQYLLAGEGPDKDLYISHCKNILNDKFRYLGVLKSSDKIEFYRNADIFILPSFFEGMPNALLEAMSYGITSIVTPVGSIPEVIINNKNGFIVPLHNDRVISDIIIKLYNNKTLLIELGTAAQKTIYESYSILNYIKKLNNIYFTVQK
jgi:glycosyltransferase involved in cell wall biosynthesis